MKDGDISLVSDRDEAALPLSNHVTCFIPKSVVYILPPLFYLFYYHYNGICCPDH